MTYQWTTKDLDDLEQFYWTEIARAMEADGRDPERDQPRYAWMCEHGFGGFIKALRRDHDLTPTEFYDRLSIGPEEEPGYWAIDHEPTRTVLESYIEELRSRRGHPETTIRPIRSRLKKYVQLYADVNETANLLDPLQEQPVRPAEIDRALAVFDVLDEVLGTPASKFKYLEDTRRFYGYLIDAGRAVYNPLERMATRFGWDRPDWDNPALDRDGVTALYRAAETTAERLLVIGLAGWGLRPAELCALRADQLVLDPDTDDQPYIAFADGERKNGPGTVALLVGANVLETRLETLSDRSDWDGYLFPSTTAASGHIVTDTVRNRFGMLADRAGVTVDGEPPTPKMGRRFWYTLYGDAVRQLAERYAPIADDQGSADPGVVLDNYLSESERRTHRRQAMHEALTTVLGEPA